jgi:hypothetical protein
MFLLLSDIPMCAACYRFCCGLAGVAVSHQPVFASLSVHFADTCGWELMYHARQLRLYHKQILL